MNDFTKEELEFIKNGLTFVLDSCSLDDESIVRVARMKILSMIDNYPKCKHESDGLCYISNPPMNKCKKCGEFYR